MSGIKTYFNKDLVVKYHPQENVINISLKSKAPTSALNSAESKIKNTLSVDSTTMNNGVRTIKLDDGSIEDMVGEFLQTFLKGGEESVDAQAVGKDAAAEDAEAPPPPDPAAAAQQPQPGTPPQAAESFGFPEVYEMLYESTYRTGEYWQTIQKALKKPAQHIDPFDIISMRKLYSRKNKSVTRDKVLRSLDRAFRYFIRFLRKRQGEEAVERFKDQYKEVDSLTPVDYAEKDKPEPAKDQEVMPAPVELKVSDFFPDEEDPEDEDDDEGEGEEVPKPGEEEYPE